MMDRATRVIEEFHKARIDATVGLIEDGRITSQVFLDIGCSTGFVTEKIAKKIGAKAVYGIEILKEAAESCKKRGIGVIIADASKNRLPFKDASIDFVLCSEVIEHLWNTDHAINEVKRILSPDGFLLISTPNLASWYNRLLLLLGYQPGWTEVSQKKFYGTPFMGSLNVPDGHIHVFTQKAFIAFLKDHGFNIIKVKSAPVLTNRMLRVFDLFLSKIPSFGAFSIVLCSLKEFAWRNHRNNLRCRLCQAKDLLDT